MCSASVAARTRPRGPRKFCCRNSCASVGPKYRPVQKGKGSVKCGVTSVVMSRRHCRCLPTPTNPSASPLCLSFRLFFYRLFDDQYVPHSDRCRVATTSVRFSHIFLKLSISSLEFPSLALFTTQAFCSSLRFIN